LSTDSVDNARGERIRAVTSRCESQLAKVRVAHSELFCVRDAYMPRECSERAQRTRSTREQMALDIRNRFRRGEIDGGERCEWSLQRCCPNSSAVEAAASNVVAFAHQPVCLCHDELTPMHSG
jgi:hypothetical protein